MIDTAARRRQEPAAVFFGNTSPTLTS